MVVDDLRLRLLGRPSDEVESGFDCLQMTRARSSILRPQERREPSRTFLVQSSSRVQMTPFKAKGVLATPLRPLSMMFLSLLTLATRSESSSVFWKLWANFSKRESTYREAKAGPPSLFVGDSFLEWMDYASGTNVEIDDAYFALFFNELFKNQFFKGISTFPQNICTASISPKTYSWNGLPLLSGHLWQARCISCIWARLSKKSLASSWTNASNATDALFESAEKNTGRHFSCKKSSLHPCLFKW